ncbi:uncharacterized protein LOC134608029 [Pelobates fuscus]|uniref:uncharacterized protein LOC134608029 n=1 Tax=Pelobates fuscus TaxID=191477 RepID=UPI002FE49377
MILEVLRHQCIYNILICSCISSNTNVQDVSDMLYFEVSLLPDYTICISFQHPTGSSLCSVSIDVVSSRDLICKAYTNKSDPPFPFSDEIITKIMTRCISIPITIRTIFKKAKEKVAYEAAMFRDPFKQLVPQISKGFLEHDGAQEARPSFRKDTNKATSPIARPYMDTELIQDPKLYPECSDSPKPCSTIVEGTDYISAQVDCSEMVQYDSPTRQQSSDDIREEHSSVAEESSPIKTANPSPFMTEGLPPHVTQETSFVTSEDTNSTEKLSSSVLEELSSSFPGDLNSSINEDGS